MPRRPVQLRRVRRARRPSRRCPRERRRRRGRSRAVAGPELPSGPGTAARIGPVGRGLLPGELALGSRGGGLRGRRRRAPRRGLAGDRDRLDGRQRPGGFRLVGLLDPPRRHRRRVRGAARRRRAHPPIDATRRPRAGAHALHGGVRRTPERGPVAPRWPPPAGGDHGDARGGVAGVHVPELRSVVPHRHGHHDAGDVVGRRHQRVRAPRGSRGGVPPRGARTVHGRVRPRADRRGDRRPERHRAVRPPLASRAHRGGGVRRSDRAGDLALVAAPGRLRPDRDRRPRDVPLPGRRARGQPRLAVAARRPPPRRSGRRRRGARRHRRDHRAGADGHGRVLEPPRADEGAPARRLAPHARPRPHRTRWVVDLRRAHEPDREVGVREHLPGRGGGLPGRHIRPSPTPP